jgi:glutaconate CoA-transferase subunit A
MMLDKRIPLEKAAEMVPSGGMLALGGLTLYRRPMAFVRALLAHYRSHKAPNQISLLSFAASLESDLLVGCGMVKSVRTCYFGMEIFGLAPMFTFLTGKGQLQVIEESEMSIALGLRAAASGLHFMPGKGWQGTDMFKLRPDVKTIQDPYTGEILTAFPAIVPDLAVIHALQADPEGNAVIGKHKSADEELAIASKTVIITAEEIVPKLDQADITAPFVDAVVHTPRGALPSSCHPVYALDGKAILEYVDQVSDQDSFDRYVNRILLGSNGNANE